MWKFLNTRLGPVTGVLIILISGLLAFYSGLINFIVFISVVILVSIVNGVSFVSMVFAFFSSKAVGLKDLTCGFVALLLPLLYAFNFQLVDYFGTYVSVRASEPYLFEMAKNSGYAKDNNQDGLKYFRLSFGRAADARRWIVYDETGQVSIDYLSRNRLWWLVSGEIAEAEGCLSNGEHLYSNFYVQYSIC